MELEIVFCIMRNIKIINIYNEEYKKEINYLILDNEVFDWGLEPDDLKNAINMINQNPNTKKAILNSIINHFINSFSEFVGKTMTLQEINLAIETGNIE